MNRIPALKLPNLTAEVLSTGVDIAVKKGALLSEDDLIALTNWIDTAIYGESFFKQTTIVSTPTPIPNGTIMCVDVPTGTQDHFELYP